VRSLLFFFDVYNVYCKPKGPYNTENVIAPIVCVWQGWILAVTECGDVYPVMLLVE
jgi:hypothetical protein